MGIVYDVESVTADGLTGFRLWAGYSMEAAAAAKVQFRDGALAGKLLGSVELTAAGSIAPVVFPYPIATAAKLWVEVVTGAPTVAVYGIA
ncbi:MAG: hypothetical protein ACT4PO_11185 [Actinomycetota bacterium]